MRSIIKAIKKSIFLLLVFCMVSTAFIFSITSLNDPLSTKLRLSTESYINHYVETLTTKAELGELQLKDKLVLHACITVSISLTYFLYPEASALLRHYVYGDGSALELSSVYFQESDYLKRIISQYGVGEHGPIGLTQSDDWRLSLALNPYYLSITNDAVKLYHPSISFAATQSERVVTIVPIGKLTIKVYDNLVNAINPKPFYVYSEWLIGDE